PRLVARRSAVHRLFDTTTVTGRLAPPLGGEHIDVTLWNNGKPIERKTTMLTRHGTFTARLEVERPGTTSVVVRFHDADHLAVAWRSKPARTSLPPPVHEGSSGPAVRLLEKRLAQLHYRVYGQDAPVDYRDAASVLAFHKVQGMARTTAVDQATWRALTHPKVPKPRGPRKGSHFEVDLTRQVVLYFRNGTVTGI